MCFCRLSNTLVDHSNYPVKANVEKGGFNAPVGATVRIEANFYLATTANVENLLLLDLECCTCWAPTVPDNQCPGVRLMMKDNDYLSIERGKILATTIEQTVAAFPRNEWVNVVWESTPSSRNNDGFNTLFVNGREVIAQSGRNMPDAQLFAAEFAQAGIDFSLQEPLFYERFQIGVTANPTGSDVALFVDDVRLEVVR